MSTDDPTGTAARSHSQTRPPQTGASAKLGSADAPINILVVDDEPRNLTVLETTLDDPRYRLVRAESADQALLALMVEEFALLILDIQMPGMNGFELAQMVKQRKKTAGIPIIFLTAYYGEDQHVLEGYGSGAVDYLHKPINPIVLRAKVAVFAELHQRTRECNLINQALLTEVTERRHVEEQLRQLNSELEQRVAERTATLSESELRFRTLAEEMPHFVWEIDAHGETTYVNAKWSAYTGLALAQCQNGGWLTVRHPDDPLAGAEAWLAALARGAEIDINQRLRRASDGAYRWFRIKAVPMRDAAGQIARWVGTCTDVQERWEAEAALVAAQAAAERANNAKSRFLAAASHDLRQPLSALSIYVTLLKSQVTPAGQARLANMKDCVASLSELLTDLLDLSKLEAGVVMPKLSTFPITEMLATLVSVHAPEARLKGLRLRCVPSRLSVRSDAVLFRRMLGNLIANAIRYSERGGVLIGCRRRQGKTWVEVWDSGIGIAEHQTQEIFEEFRQLGDTARNRGSGLGLAIVAKTAALLGLEITVRSWPGRGSVFAIELPVPTAPPIEPETPMLEQRAWTCRALCIALVEDNLIVRQALAYALQDIGHQVLAAASGAELQAQLDGLKPDVIITDYRLAAGETGFDVIAAVRAALGDDLPAILITGDTDPDLMRSMVDRGIIVLHKPVQIETLEACLAGF
ncbi:MAG: response regulator [Leptothrix sp. (in: b-proteobacteria)]